MLTRVEIERQGDRFSTKLPPLCVYCGAPSWGTLPVSADGGIGRRKVRTTWQVPYCREHAALQTTQARRLNMLGTSVATFLIASVVMLLVLGALVEPGPLMFPAVWVLGDTATFTFTNPEAGKEFARLNGAS